MAYYGTQSIYDSPGLALDNLLQGNLQGVWKSFQDPDSLASEERTAIERRIGKMLTQEDAGGAMSRVLLNPWTIGAFLLTPTAMRTMAKQGRLVGQLGTEYSVWGKKNFPYLNALKDATNAYSGTPAARIAMDVQDARNMAHIEDLKPLEATEQALFERIERRLGLKEGTVHSLDPNDARTDKLREYLEERNTVLQGYLQGWDQPSRARATVEYSPRVLISTKGKLSGAMEGSAELLPNWKLNPAGYEGMPDGPYEQTIKQWERLKKGEEAVFETLIDGKPVAVEIGLGPSEQHRHVVYKGERTEGIIKANALRDDLMAEGWLEHAESIKDSLDLRRARLFLNDEGIAATRDAIANGRRLEPEEIAEFIDSKKLEASAVGLKSEAVKRMTGADAEDWDEGLEMLFGDKAMDQLRQFEPAGYPLSRAKWEQMLVDSYLGNVTSGQYFPRNGKRYWKPVGKGRYEEVQQEDVIHREDVAITPAGSTGLRTRKDDEIPWDRDDMERLARATGIDLSAKENRGFKDLLVKSVNRPAKWTYEGKRRQPPPHQVTHSLNATQNLRTYFNSTGRSWAAFHRPVTEQFLAEQREFLTNWHRYARELDAKGETLTTRSGRMPAAYDKGRTWKAKGDKEMPMGLPGARKWSTHWKPGTLQEPAGGYNYALAMEQVYQMIPEWNQMARRQLSDVVFSGAMGMVPHETIVGRGVNNTARAVSKFLSEGPTGQLIKQQSPELWEALDWRSKADPRRLGGSAFLSSLLYSSHLGYNPGSVMLNAMQPVIGLMPYAGGRDTIPAWATAVGEVADYLKLRSKQGLRISPNDRIDTAKKAFKHFDAMGIDGDQLDMLDAVAFGTRRPDLGLMNEVPGWGKWFMKDAALSMFGKVEWLNRATTAHAAERLFKRQGIDIATNPAMFKQEAERLVQATQFGSGLLNSPMLLLPGRNKSGVAQMMSDPVMRQFMTFPMRMGMLPFTTALGGESLRSAAGLREMARFGIRAMGISAMVNSIAQETMDADLSRGLFWDASTELYSGLTGGVEERGNRYTGSALGILPSPPIIDMFADVVEAVGKADLALLTESLVMRTAPGGMAASRLLQVAPELPFLPEGMQRTHADYGARLEDGRVPVFKGDGSLVDYRSPSSLIMQGLGVNLGAHRKGGNFDHWLTTQRDEILKYRQTMLNAMHNNDMGRVSSTRAEFEKRFGFPLTVTKEQVRAYGKKVETPRPERMLDRMPREIRDQMAVEMWKQRGDAIERTEQEIVDYPTSTRRTEGRPRPSSLSPETYEMMMEQAALQELEEERRQRDLAEGAY